MPRWDENGQPIEEAQAAPRRWDADGRPIRARGTPGTLVEEIGSTLSTINRRSSETFAAQTAHSQTDLHVTTFVK
jgi:hypothetical protein